jgi:hypothetical protein
LWLANDRSLALNERMGLLSLFKSKAPVTTEPATTAPEKSAELWRHTPFTSFVAGEDVHSVYLRGRLPALVPSFVVDFALRCTQFRPLEEHIASHAELHAWGSLEVEALRSWLPKMTAAGMLISREEAFARAAAIRRPKAEPAKITTIGFPTGGDRGAMLSRALRSFAGNVRTHRRHVDWVIADNSNSAELRARARQHVAQIGTEFDFPMHFFGEEEKRRFAAELLRRSGCRPEALEFALFDPLGAGFACGANRNALLLHEAGAVLSSVDDDVICEMAPAPAAEERVAFFSGIDPYERWVFPDRASALEAVRFEERDYLAAHETLLGRDLSDLTAGLKPTDLNLTNTGLGFLRLLETGAAQVRTTYMGYVGDPGIPTSCFYFFHKGKNRERLTGSEEEYRAGFASRSVLCRVPVASVGDDTVAPGMAIGLDHREILPPFFPVLHAEDCVFGTAAWASCAGLLSGHLPLAIHHDSGANKPTLQPSDLSSNRRAAVFEFAQIVRAIMAGYTPAEHADSVSRLQKLGRHLSEFAALPPLDFHAALHHVVLGHESGKIVALDDSLRNEADAPDFWKQDLQDFLDHTREALQHEDFDIPYELKAGRSSAENRVLMQKLIASYGLLLEEWPAIVAAARDLREAGIRFSVRANPA